MCGCEFAIGGPLQLFAKRQAATRAHVLLRFMMSQYDRAVGRFVNWWIRCIRKGSYDFMSDMKKMYTAEATSFSAASKPSRQSSR